MILGLDLALATCGWCLVDSRTKQVRSFGNFYLPDTGVRRLVQIELELQKVVGNYDIDWCFIEGYGYSPSYSNNLVNLGEAGGIARVFFYLLQIPVAVVAPPTVKKWLTGSGKADKKQIMDHIKKRFGIDFKVSHEADAFCLAMIGVMMDRYIMGVDKNLDKLDQQIHDTLVANKVWFI